MEASAVFLILVRSAARVACGPGFRAFSRELDDPASAQRRALSRIIRDLAKTEYGREHGLSGSESLVEFRARLPVVNFQALEPWVEKQKKRAEPILSASPIDLYEKTSGSSGASKYIPYSRELRSVFSRMAERWVYDLLVHGPKLRAAKIFISVSPAFQADEKTESGASVGLEDDSDYLSGPLKWLLSRYLVAPNGIKSLKDPVDYLWVLSCALIAAEDLEVLSVWSPSYLTAILEFAYSHRREMEEDLLSGRVFRGGREFRFRPVSRDRLQRLESREWSRLWARLRLISCWTDAAAEGFARELAEIFPDALMQGKGLLATECPMTLPLVASPAPVPLVDDVFYEFEDERGDLYLLHELAEGSEYEIIVSPRGGFARYRIGDRVRVSGRYRNTPCLRFIGRTGQVSDLVGEKLSEVFVRESLGRLPALRNRVWFMIPVRSEGAPRYLLVVSRSPESPDPIPAETVDQVLASALHYRYARQLGQLAQAEIHEVPDARAFYFDYFVSRGMKWGDIKFVSLISRERDAEGLARILMSRS